MKSKALLIILLLFCQSSYGIIYSINSQTNLVVPYFRGSSNTTWFEWTDGDFYGFPVPALQSRILNNTIPSDGSASILTNVQFYQNDRYSNNPTIIGSSGGNIYTGFGANGKQASATLVVPTFHSLTNGFTTVIIQGVTVPEGGFAPVSQLILNYPTFTLNGTAASFIISSNAVAEGQWWAQFNIPSGNTNYTFNVNFAGGTNTYPISVAGLSVDTYWSQTGYADIGSVVPEPSTYYLLIVSSLGILFLIIRRKIRKLS
jgi:hypothetical protein